MNTIFNSLEKQSTYKVHPFSLSLPLSFFQDTNYSLSNTSHLLLSIYRNAWVFFTFIHICYCSQTLDSETILPFHIDARGLLNGY